MRRLFTLVSTIVFILAAQMLTESQTPNDNNKEQLAELLAKTVSSLGGAEKLQAMRSLTMTGTFRRAFPDQDRSGAYELDFMSPESFKKIETGEATKGVEFTFTQTLTKSESWSGTDVKTGGIKLNLGSRKSPRSSSPNERKQMLANFAAHLLPWFIAAPGFGSIQLRSGGSASVLHLRGADDFTAHVILDPKTYLPMLMSYRGRPPVIVLDMSKLEETMPEPDAEIQVHFSDYRAEDGIVLPHHIKVESGGKLLEEFEMKTCRINPAEMTASAFVRH